MLVVGRWVEAEKTDIQKCFVNIKLSLSIYVLGLRIYFLIQHKTVTAIMFYHYQESLQLDSKCLQLQALLHDH